MQQKKVALLSALKRPCIIALLIIAQALSFTMCQYITNAFFTTESAAKLLNFMATLSPLTKLAVVVVGETFDDHFAIDLWSRGTSHSPPLCGNIFERVCILKRIQNNFHLILKRKFYHQMNK